jgi:hypothetical protein
MIELDNVYTCPNQKYEYIPAKSYVVDMNEQGIYMDESLLNALKELGPNFNAIDWLKNSGNQEK